MKPSVPLHDPAFVYVPAATHGTSEAFAKRQRERFLRAHNLHDAEPAAKPKTEPLATVTKLARKL